MKKNHLLSIILTGLFILSSCETGVTPPDDPNDPNDPTSRFEIAQVLNTNSAFENVWDTTMDVRTMNTGVTGSLGISDFTVDAKNQMHFVFYQILPSQQSTFYESYRRTWDLTNKKIIPQNPLAYKEKNITRNLYNYQAEKELAFELYKPYTNYYVAAIVTSEGSGGISYNKVYFQGDVSMTVAQPFYPLSRLELGYENVVGQSAYFQSVIFRSLNRKNDDDFNYKFTNVSMDYAIFQYMVPDVQTYHLLCEARTSGPSIYFGFTSKNEIQAIEFTETGNFGTTSLTGTEGKVVATVNWTPYVTWVTQAFVYPVYNFGKTIRHYSPDGSIMSFALNKFDTDRYSTFVYNFNTKAFTKVLEDVSLKYGDINSSDVDIDQEGNIYYTGYADSGKNKEGVSVYKISADGNHTLVGNDNFLKFGQVIKLKHLHGKLYLCVTGKKTGYDTHQISFIRTK